MEFDLPTPFPTAAPERAPGEKHDCQAGQHRDLRPQLPDGGVAPEHFQVAVERPGVERDQADFCIVSLMRKRGNMLPPSADMVRIRMVEKPESCAREARVARISARAAAAADVASVITAKPGRCENSGKPNATVPTGTSRSAARSRQHQEHHLPTRIPDIPMRVHRRRSSVPDSTSSRTRCRGADHGKQQEHHADARGIKRDERRALVAAAHDVDDLQIDAHRRGTAAGARSAYPTPPRPEHRQPRLDRRFLLRRELSRVLSN